MSAPLKVINLGLPKSGTTTLGEALKAAGLRVADWRLRPAQGAGRGFVGKLMYDGYFGSGDPLALMPEFDAFTEIEILRHGMNLWPQCDWGLISAIRARHPGAKFLLNTRDPALISDSMERWSNLGRTRLPQNDVPGLPRPWGGSHAERILWINGHFNFVRQVFKDAEDFMEFEISDPEAPQKLSRFLGLELPWWGVANANLNHPADEEA